MIRRAAILAGALLLTATASAKPPERNCAASERDPRGRCPDKPGAKAGGKGGVKPVRAAPKADLRERKAVSFENAPVAGDLARPAAAPLAPDPSARAPLVRPELEVQVDDAMIAEYQRGSETLPDSDPDKPSYFLHLADARAARYRKANKAARAAATAARAAKTPADKSAREAEQKGHQKVASDELVLAVKAYSAVTSNRAFASFDKLDEAMGRLGILLEESAQLDNARLLYRRLSKEFPSSRYAGVAVLALAEQAFDAGKLVEAAAGYSKLLPDTKATIYPYVRYKMGWVLFNQSRPKDAYASLTEAVEAAAALKQTTLVRAAERDSVRMFAEFGSPAEADLRLRKLSPKNAPTLLALLADSYLDMGKFAEAVALYQALMKSEPKSPKLCEWGFAAARTSMALPGGADQKVASVRGLVSLYKHVVGTRLLGGPALTKCQTDVEQMVREMALVWHQEGAKTLNGTTLAAAQELYTLYFDNFNQPAHAAELRNYRAELLWTRAEHEKNARLQGELWREAALAFTRAAKTPGMDPKAVKEAAYSAILAWRNATGELKSSPATGEGDDKAPAPAEPLSDDVHKMLAAIGDYLNLVKSTDEAAGMQFLIGRIYYSHRHYPEAVTAFAKVVTSWPDDEGAEHAANLLLDSLNHTAQYPELIGWVRKLREEPRYAGLRAKMGEMLDVLMVQSQRKEAEAQEAKGDHAGCGRTYALIVKDFPDYEALDEVLYNSMVCFKRAARDAEAKTMFDLLARAFPKSPLVARAKAVMAK